MLLVIITYKTTKSLGNQEERVI